MRVLIYGSIIAVAFLSAPGTASATRPATEQEIAEFRTAARTVENITHCAVLVRASASDSCQWVPRPDYEPVITEARISTLDETWATAFLSPAPRTTEAATVVFRQELQQAFNNGIPETRGVWHMLTSGNGCELLAERSFGESHGTQIRLMPDLVAAMGCTPLIPTKVRCLDELRTSFLALERPHQCAVAAPKGFPFHGWMNNRELRWHRWGNEDRAWALGVTRGVPARLRRGRFSSTKTIRGVSTTTPEWPPPVRLVASGRVSCGTSYFYSRLHVISNFGRFAVTLPTCPDQFFAPR
ncbi:MAG TPA: hypothetical protein VKC63_03140 [Solirubrobacterales bacterium]|nr:hypothetical protein [Solirubrobacterales bacterium]